MADVTVSIGGHNYTIACREGEEPHLREIAEIVDVKAHEAREAVGSVSEVRQLMFAALLLADDLSESRKNAGSAPSAPQQGGDPALATALEQLAQRVENLASALEQRAGNH
jgi:cell division protein ZapA